MAGSMTSQNAKEHPPTAEPVRVPPALGTIITPEFLRLPHTGTTCPHSGLSRAKMNALILPDEQNGHKPPVKSFSLRPKGATRGVRLISYISLMSYLRGEMAAQEQGQAA